MDVEITTQNYRFFSEERTAKIVLRSGEIAFVGINNSGKSTLLLRLCFELALSKNLPDVRDVVDA